MKSLLLALAFVSSSLLISNSAHAYPVVDQSPLVASIRGNYDGLKSVDLYAGGRMDLTDSTGTVTSVGVSEASRKELLSKAQSLASAKVKVELMPAICMMMPPPELGELYVAEYDYATDVFSGTPRFILSAFGCYVSRRATPEDVYSVRLATELRAQILILALEAKK